MRLSLIYIASAIGTVLASGAITFNVNSVNVPGCASAGYLLTDLLDDAFGKRDSVSSNVSLSSSYNFYVTEVEAGTPPQKLQVGFDTGSPYLWFFGPNGSVTNASQFYPNESSTLQYDNQNFSIAYAAGFVNGIWVNDNIQISDNVIEEFPFGVVNQYSLGAEIPGLIGIGPGPNLTNETYSNVPEAFYQQGVTNSPIFSLFLDKDTNAGGVIFGGIDTTRFKPPVYQYNIVKSGYPNQPAYYYQLRLDAMAVNGNNYSVGNIAVLDTGAPFCSLPANFIAQVGNKTGLTPYSKYQTYYVNGTQEYDKSVVISVMLGHFKVDIPITEFLVPGSYLWGTDGPQGVMALAMLGGNQYVLGDVFFKHVYSAFDSKNSMVYLANSSKDFTKSNVVELQGSEFPGAIQGYVPVSGPTTLTPRPPNTSVTGTAPMEGNGGYSVSSSAQPTTTVFVTVTSSVTKSSETSTGLPGFLEVDSILDALGLTNLTERL